MPNLNNYKNNLNIFIINVFPDHIFFFKEVIFNTYILGKSYGDDGLLRPRTYFSVLLKGK